jgi:hypothetical protein
MIVLRFSVFRLLTDFVCLYTYEFLLSLCKIVRSSVILLLSLFSANPLVSVANVIRANVRRAQWSYWNKTVKIVVKAVPNPVKQMSKTSLRHTLINKYFWHFCWLPYIYTFSLNGDCKKSAFRSWKPCRMHFFTSSQCF